MTIIRIVVERLRAYNLIAFGCCDQADLTTKLKTLVSLAFGHAFNLRRENTVQFDLVLFLLQQQPLGYAQELFQLRIWIWHFTLQIAKNTARIGLELMRRFASALVLLGLRVTRLLRQQLLAKATITLAQLEATIIRGLLIFSTLAFAQDEFIKLTWTPNLSPCLSHYKLYRDNQPGTMVYLDSISSNDTIYTDTQVVAGNTYYYKLTAVDFSGNESVPSNEVIVTVNDDGNNAIKNFDLKQNYPNPFNPTTTIEYSIPRQCRVYITIYNISGQEMRRLTDEVKVAGTYKVEWDGKDNNGRTVSSGVYFCQMVAEDYTRADFNQMIVKAYKGVKKPVLRK